MSLDDQKYSQLQERYEKDWEALCRGCGACCGAVEGDPCEHLALAEEGKYFCKIYETRFGLHKTKSKESFCCVPIRQILHKTWSGNELCAYKLHMKRKLRQ